MRYTLDKDGYILDVFFNCYSGSGGCKEYTGEVPAGYSDIDDWVDNALINAYKIDEDGNLVLDTIREAYLKALYEEQQASFTPANKKYVDDKLKSVTSVLADEITTLKESGDFTFINDAGSYPIHKFEILSEIISPLIIKTSNKNMLGSDVVNGSYNGVNLVVNEDRTITLNGTATADTEVNLWANLDNNEMLFLLKNSLDFYLSGLENLTLNLYANSSEGNELVYSGSNALINLSEDKKITCVSLVIPTGTALKNVTIKPQLEYSNVASDYIQHLETKKVTTSGLIENELETYEDVTLIMINEVVDISFTYYVSQYFTNKFSEIETKVDSITLSTYENAESISGILENISELTLTTEGLTNTLSSRGGDNYFKNSYFSELENGSLTFWDGPCKAVSKYESESKTALSLQNGIVKQTIELQNGTYALGFKFEKLIPSATCQVRYNNRAIDLTEESGAIETIEEITTGALTIEFECDTLDGFLIYEPMLNKGDTLSLFSQNKDESNGDTVKIGKGVQVENTAIDSYTRLDADGLRGFNKSTGEVTFAQTDKGIKGKNAEFEQIQSGSLIITTRNSHNFLSGL